MRRIMSSIAVSICLLALSAGAVLAAPPGNDEIADAIEVTALPFTDTADTSEATTAADDPDCIGNGPTVWYVYTPSVDQRLLADTFGSDYDTTLSAYTGSPGDLTQIACNDDAGADLQSAVVVEAEAGTTYYFMVGAFGSGPGGSLVFNIDETDLSPSHMDITIDGTGRFTKDGTAIISGTATCNEGEFAFVDVSLEQRVGRFIIRGFGFTELECDGTAQAWSVEVFGETGTFKGGRAEAFAFGETCNQLDCAFDFEQRTVSLKRQK